MLLVAGLACGDDSTPSAVREDASTGRVDAAAAADAVDAGDTAHAGDTADAGDPCAPVVHDILLTCGSIVCHDPETGGIGTVLDLSRSADLPASLIGVPASEACGAVPYIDPERPEQSLLILKLDDTPPCGERMPAGDRPGLEATQRACFEQWVTAAAAQP